MSETLRLSELAERRLVPGLRQALSGGCVVPSYGGQPLPRHAVLVVRVLILVLVLHVALHIAHRTFCTLHRSIWLVGLAQDHSQITSGVNIQARRRCNHVALAFNQSCENTIARHNT